MLASTGVPTRVDIEKAFPNEARMNQGASAVIECFQNIPCNPCYTACNRNAIKEFQDINDLPLIDHEQCNGCGLCISKCPGLAIMVVDMSYSEHEGLLKIPYEFIPLPVEGDIVRGLDRSGKHVCDVKVVKVLNTKYLDRTPIISIAVPKEYIHNVRNIGMGD
ncbi:4Fe-4S binding protein [Anaerosolibacter sp.]|uniref:4Fe-4S binding protein n=1 Tax=Anaerosolibacter sp. TaxID=1872527 RepID=UPI0039F13D20